MRLPRTIAILSLTCMVVATLISCNQSDESQVSNNEIKNAIIKGSPVDESDIRAQSTVTVVWKDSSGLYHPCSGVMINNYWAMTTAHCMYFPYPIDVRVIKGPSPVHFATTLPTEQEIYAKGIYLHPDVDRYRYPDFLNVIKVSTDVALVELNAPLKINNTYDGFMQKIYSGTLPSLYGRPVTVYGYGSTGAPDVPGLVFFTQAQMDIRNVNAATHDFILPQNGLGQKITYGDSGGPTFLGNELVGIHQGAHGLTETRDIAAQFFRNWVLMLTNTELGREDTISVILDRTTNLNGTLVGKFTAPSSTTAASFYASVGQSGRTALFANIVRVDTINRDGRELGVYSVFSKDYFLDMSRCDPYIMGAKTCRIYVNVVKTDGSRIINMDNRAIVK